jgi:hypothetical protein
MVAIIRIWVGGHPAVNPKIEVLLGESTVRYYAEMRVIHEFSGNGGVRLDWRMGEDQNGVEKLFIYFFLARHMFGFNNLWHSPMRLQRDWRVKF